MTRYYLPLVFFGLISSSGLLGAVQEIKNIKEVANYLESKKSTVVIFDIDNTLLHPHTDLGSDQWFSHKVRENSDKGMEIAEAVKQILPLYFHINFNCDLILTEPTLAEDIVNIKKSCQHMICLTARSLPLGERTIQQLHAHKLYFEVAELDVCIMHCPHPCLYRNGCLFCGSNGKGEVLLAFLDALKYQPDLIIFVDDKEANLHVVESAAQKRNIECICLRYVGCDERVRNFDAAKTELELSSFLKECPLS